MSLLLLADIGGTNARFAIATRGASQSAAPLQAYDKLKVADYPTPSAALHAYLRKQGLVSGPGGIEAACIAVAGPVTGDHFAFTNAHWSFSAKAIAKEFGWSYIKIINDYEAQAMGLPDLSPQDLRQIGGARAEMGETKVVLGPGTGLGVGALVQHGDVRIPIVGEGGHVSFAPQDELEVQLLQAYWAKHPGRISVERLLAGYGLEALYSLMVEQAGQSPNKLKAADISDQALSDPNSFARQVILRYLQILGSLMGDLAVTFSAYGGVYLTGGVAAAIEPLLDEGSLRRAFENKGRVSTIVKKAPIFLIQTHETPLLGALYAINEGLGDHSAER